MNEVKRLACSLVIAAAEVHAASGAKSPEREVRRYEAEGFSEGVTARIHDVREPAAKGFSSTFRFDSQSGAQAEMAAETTEFLNVEALHTTGGRYLVLKHLKIPGVRFAVGYAFVTNRAASVLGVKSGVARGWLLVGNCLVSVGIYRPASKEVTDSVIAGVQAISKRTENGCP
jgi:hypothetical protein